MSKITYTDKVTLNENPNVADVNKVKANDLNEIKNVVNANDDKFNYTQEEQIIGTWIDGKPIYRKVSNVSISNKSTWTSLISIPNLDRLINVYGFGNNVTLPRYESPNYYVQFLFEVDYLKYMANGISGSASIVTEYTKTTD